MKISEEYLGPEFYSHWMRVAKRRRRRRRILRAYEAERAQKIADLVLQKQGNDGGGIPKLHAHPSAMSMATLFSLPTSASAATTAFPQVQVDMPPIEEPDSDASTSSWKSNESLHSSDYLSQDSDSEDDEILPDMDAIF